MKRLMIMICAVTALVCSCGKYEDAVDDLNKRVDVIEATDLKLVSKLEALQILANAKEAQITISSIKKSEEGLEVCFSNGTKYLIVPGAQGPAGPDGEDKIIVTETETTYTFDFGEGDVITVLKTFCLLFESDTVEAPAASEAVIKYELLGADASVHVVANALDGCKILGIDEEAQEITVLSSGRKGEHFVSIRAIRNSDAKVCEKIFSVISTAPDPIKIDGAMTGYYGDSKSDNSDYYLTQFWAGELDEEDMFVGEAYSLIFGCWAPISETMALPAGTFVADVSTKPFTFTAGKDMFLREYIDENYYIYLLFGYTYEEIAELMGYSADELDTRLVYAAGAEFYHQFEDGSYDDYGITEGTVTVEIIGAGTYRATLDFVAGDRDWSFFYEGEIPVEDHRPAPAWYDECIVTNNGDIYENNTTSWSLVCNKTKDPTYSIYLEVIGPKDATEIPTGEFEVSYSPDENTVYAENTYMYYNSGFIWNYCDSGVLTISMDENGKYHMVGEFVDEYYSEDWDFEFIGYPSYSQDKTPAVGNPGRGKGNPKEPVKRIESRLKATVSAHAKRGINTPYIQFK